MEEETQPIMTLKSSKISTVVPATPRGDEHGVHHLSNMDLLMKLHYIRAVQFFIKDAVQGLSIYDLKAPMFTLLDQFVHLSGRIRISESGRPSIKCNDAGIRIAESHGDHTLGEWFQKNGCSLQGLVHDHVLGPDLGFSPLVFVKFTWFNCGGLSVGLSWSHVLGDAFSAFNFITKWSQTLAGHAPPKTLSMQIHKETQTPHDNPVHGNNNRNHISVKTATTVRELWLATNHTKMVTHTFHITPKKLNHLVSSTFPGDQNQASKASYFEILSALVWKHIARIRGDNEPKVVTICTRGTGRNEFPFHPNGLVLSVVETNVEVGKSDVSDLARLIGEERRVDNVVVENLVEESQGKGDFVVYGANLTFVDLEESDMYEVVLNGHKPILANCSIHGVGDQGVVLVLPGIEEDEENRTNIGRMVTVSLPEKDVDQLKEEWGTESSLPF